MQLTASGARLLAFLEFVMGALGGWLTVVAARLRVLASVAGSAAGTWFAARRPEAAARLRAACRAGLALLGRLGRGTAIVARRAAGSVSRRSRSARLLWLASGLLCAMLVVGAAGYLAVASTFVPPPQMLARAAGLEILDRHGEPLFVFDVTPGPRQTVPLAAVSPHLVAATVATEDAGFWTEPGLNPRGLARAVYENLAFWKHGGFLRGGGGSSISQQLAKLLYIKPEDRADRSLIRKYREAVLALEMNRRYSKEQILEWYLNELYYGNGAYGPEEAAQRYFSRPASELTLAEAALLAGIPNAPARFEPLYHPAGARERQLQVLGLMVRHKVIAADVAAAAGQPESSLQPRALESKAASTAPHFAAYVRDVLPGLIGEAARSGGLKVYTSLDVNLQQQAELTVRQQLERIGPSTDATNAALVAIAPQSGEILAMVGSRNFDDPASGQVNNALTLNNPGSTLKPITYLGAFMKGWAPATIVEDSPLVLNDGGRPYTVRNADGWYRGRVSVRQALGNSLNAPAVRALQFVGLEQVYATSKLLGLSTLQDLSAYGPAFTLGGLDANLLDLTFVYAVLANGGQQSGTRNGSVVQGARPLDPVAVLRVEDGEGRRLWEHRAQRETLVPAPPVYLVTNVLADNGARTQMFGTSNALTLPGRQAAVKTGLSDEARDAWAFGFTPQLVVGVWVGKVDNSPMRNATSGTTAAPIWQQFMSAALRGQPTLDFAPPEGVQFVAVCASTGLPSGGCRDSVREVFTASTVPQAPSAQQPGSGDAAPPPSGGGKNKGKR